MPLKSTVSKATAFRRYADMGAGRSVLALFRALKADGYRIGRQTLMTWSASDHWELRLAKRDATTPVAQALTQSAVLLASAADLSQAEKISSTVASLAAMTTALAELVAKGVACLPAEALPVEDVVTLARTAGHMGETLAKVHAIMTAPPATPKDITPSAGAASTPVPPALSDLVKSFGG